MCRPNGLYFYFALRQQFIANHEKHEKCDKIIKHTSVEAAAHPQIVGGGGGATTIKNRLGGANELSAAAKHGWCRALPADQVLDFNQLIIHSTFIFRAFKIPPYSEL